MTQSRRLKSFTNDARFSLSLNPAGIIMVGAQAHSTKKSTGRVHRCLRGTATIFASKCALLVLTSLPAWTGSSKIVDEIEDAEDEMVQNALLPFKRAGLGAVNGAILGCLVASEAGCVEQPFPPLPSVP